MKAVDDQGQFQWLDLPELPLLRVLELLHATSSVGLCTNRLSLRWIIVCLPQ